MANKKIEINLNETKKFQLALTIKGSLAESIQKPIIRFSILNEKTGFSCSFPVKNEDNSIISFNIPELNHIFTESDVCKGSLEIIAGNKYYMPLTMDIAFTQGLKIEADLFEETNVEPEEYLEEVKEVIKTPKPKSKIDQRILQKAVFSDAKPASTPTVDKPAVKTIKNAVVKPGPIASPQESNSEEDVFEAYKRKLKSMIAEAISDSDE